METDKIVDTARSVADAVNEIEAKTGKCLRTVHARIVTHEPFRVEGNVVSYESSVSVTAEFFQTPSHPPPPTVPVCQ